MARTVSTDQRPRRGGNEEMEKYEDSNLHDTTQPLFVNALPSSSIPHIPHPAITLSYLISLFPIAVIKLII